METKCVYLYQYKTLPLFAKAKIGLLFGSAKTRCFVPRAVKARRDFGKGRKSVPAAFAWF